MINAFLPISTERAEANSVFDLIQRMSTLGRTGREEDYIKLLEMVSHVVRDSNAAIVVITLMALIIEPAQVEPARQEFIREVFDNA